VPLRPTVIAPFAVSPDDTHELQPDVLVARRFDLTDKNLTKPPVLVVEVFSPDSRLVDANLKRAAYARLGVPWYWLVDPSRLRLPCWSWVKAVSIGRPRTPWAVRFRPRQVDHRAAVNRINPATTNSHQVNASGENSRR
jgi:Uma2 family endonuclease